eukprot:7851166-Pyramimonas_sp.AAC.1
MDWMASFCFDCSALRASKSWRSFLKAGCDSRSNPLCGVGGVVIVGGVVEGVGVDWLDRTNSDSWFTVSVSLESPRGAGDCGVIPVGGGDGGGRAALITCVRAAASSWVEALAGAGTPPAAGVGTCGLKLFCV